MAQRMKEYCLHEVDGLVYVDDVTYSGIGYEILDEKNQSKYYENGILCGPYRNECIPHGKDLLHVDGIMLMHNQTTYSGEPVTYAGKNFTGIAYDFQDDRCIAETYYLNGIKTSWAHFFHSGKPEQIEIAHENAYQRCSWHNTGIIAEMRLVVPDLFSAKFGFTQQNELKSMSLETGDYFSLMGSVRNELRIPVIEHKSFFEKVYAAERLFLAGKFITDEIFDSLWANNGFKGMLQLDLFHTSLTGHSVDKLSESI